MGISGCCPVLSHAGVWAWCGPRSSGSGVDEGVREWILA